MCSAFHHDSQSELPPLSSLNPFWSLFLPFPVSPTLRLFPLITTMNDWIYQFEGYGRSLSLSLSLQSKLPMMHVKAELNYRKQIAII